MTAREHILARLRGRSPSDISLPDVYRTAGRPADAPDLFARRAREAAAEVVVAPAHGWARQLAAQMRDRGVRTVAVWEDPLLAPAVEALREAGMAIVGPGEHTPQRLDACDAGLTTAEAAVATSGTLVLACGPGRPRTTSLLPPLHVTVLPAGRVVATLEDLLAGLPRPLPSALTLISGPSRTADIELVPVRGVHGPTDVVVYVLG
ncbi:MAG: LUD domain-containing protein [Armatimonadota bacterium]|nr:LUD domain-containing protein [Armatimonadota bacterium]MDR7403665.1 LUD domain-containing protein [Armatimonadota bacterium]